VSSADFLLYVERLGEGRHDLTAEAVLERMSTVLVLLWMCATAWQAERAR
jgi:hypothetical protein